MKNGFKKILVENTKTTKKDRTIAQLLAKLFIFTLSIIWVLIYCAVILVLYDKWFNPAMVFHFTPNLPEASSIDKVLVGVCDAWYIITAVLIGTWASLKAFKTVGFWAPKSKDSDATSK